MAIQRFETIPRLPRRSPGAHKGDFGHVLAIAGGRGMAGAAGIVGGACLRSGAGLVTVASPSEVQPTVSSYEPSYMTYPLATAADGFVDFRAARADLERLAGAADVIAAGPGLGKSDEVRALARWLVQEVEKPRVLDADALNALASSGSEPFDGLIGPAVITPHPGEFGRLLGKSAAEVQDDREGLAAEFAASNKLIVLLKGKGTIVTDGTRLYVNESGNPGMATGGAGDCLTGVIAALMGQGFPPFEAAVLGAFAHGLAGDLAAEHSGQIGMIAGDVVDAIPDAFERIQAEG